MIDNCLFLCYNLFMYAEVALTHGDFTYSIPERFKWISVGYPVLVPFRNKTSMGIVIKIEEKTDIENIKPIKSVLYEEPLLGKELLSLSSRMAEYYGGPLASCINPMIPSAVRERIKNRKPLRYFAESHGEKREKNKLTLSNQLNSEIKGAISQNHFKTFLVHGRERMEVYLASIEYTLNEGKDAILLFPGISPTSKEITLIKEKFGEGVAVIHSSSRQQASQWEGIRRGVFRICIGSMSAVFSPFQRLGIIIVDEEDSDAYKAINRPYYNIRDVAIMRANLQKIPCIIGSASPSFESFHNAKKSKYHLISLNNKKNIPVKIVDMRKEKSILSGELSREIEKRLKKGEKTILLLPRKGYSHFCMCLDCGWIPQCPHCSVTLDYYRNEHKLLCHYCGYKDPAPSVCRNCNGIRFAYPGTGTERLEGLIKRQFKNSNVIRMDATTLKKGRKYEDLYTDFLQNGDILLGTQMVIKTYKSKTVTLLGIVSCDSMLSFPDFRAKEKLFSLIMRAKRGIEDGDVILQTYNPDDQIFKFIKEDDYNSFYREEIKKRRKHNLPPFIHLIRILSFSNKKEGAQVPLNKLKSTLKKSGYSSLGPSPCPLEILKGKWRHHIIAKVTDPRKFFSDVNLPPGLSVEVDPREMM